MTFTFHSDRPIDVICMGRVAVDLYAEQIFSPLSEVQTFRKYLGGCAGNIAVGTARLGLRSMMFSCVGKDEMGQFVKATLQKEGVDIRLLYETDKHLTGLVLLGIHPPDHFPLIFYRNQCADMQLMPGHINDELFTQAKALLITGTCLSTESMRNTTMEAVQRAKELQTAIILDIDYRPALWGVSPIGDGETRYKYNPAISNVYQQLLPFCDLIVGTEDEICIAGGEQQVSAAINVIHQYADAPIVVKNGEKGCQVFIKDQATLCSLPFTVEVLNVLGAGDAFMSGLLRGLLSNESWETATTYANAAGALVVTRHGCAPAIPDFNELQQFIKGNTDGIERLHHKVVMRNAQKQLPLVMLGFHESQINSSTGFTLFRNAVYEGLCIAVAEQNLKSSLGVIDEHDEQHKYQDKPKEYHVNMPFEKLAHAYSNLVKRPSSWGVHVNWPLDSQIADEQQWQQLTALAQACDTLERRMMIEIKASNQLDVVKQMYERQIYPYSWLLTTPLNTSDWQLLEAVLDEHDSNTTILLLVDDNTALPIKQSRYLSGLVFHNKTYHPLWDLHQQNGFTVSELINKSTHHYANLLKNWEQ